MDSSTYLYALLSLICMKKHGLIFQSMLRKCPFYQALLILMEIYGFMKPGLLSTIPNFIFTSISLSFLYRAVLRPRYFPALPGRYPWVFSLNPVPHCTNSVPISVPDRSSNSMFSFCLFSKHLTASSKDSSVTCIYLSIVVLMLACPSSFCRIFGCMPLSMTLVAYVCRRA